MTRTEATTVALSLIEQAETLLRVLRVLRRRMLGRPAGMQALPPSYMELLTAARRDPGLRVRDAAVRLQLASNTVSTIAGKLDAAGLLERRRDDSDHRGVRLFLTDAAERRLSAWRDQRIELLASVLADLPPGDRNRIVAALPALDRMAEALWQRGLIPPSAQLDAPPPPSK